MAYGGEARIAALEGSPGAGERGPNLAKHEAYIPLFVFVEYIRTIYFEVPDGAIDMSLFAILLFVGTMTSSLWSATQVRQVYDKFSQLPASPGSSGAETSATILRQEGISNTVERATYL